jgi:hypothetical protein
MKRNREAGQVLVTAALTLTFLLLAAGLAIDMGYLRYQKRQMQTAADSAALAAAAEIYGDLTGAAQADAGLNGFTVPTVDACPPPAPSPGTPTMCAQQYTLSANASLNAACASSTPCAQVTISQSEPTFFMRIAGINSENVSASAMARLGPGPGCLYALGPDITFSDPIYNSFAPFQADIDVDSGVYANSCAVMSAGSVGSSGFSHELRTSVIGSSDPPNCAGSCSPGQFTPQPAQWTKIAAPPDPLAYLQSNPPPPGSVPPCSYDCPVQPCGYNFCSLELSGYSYPTGIAIDNSGNYTFQPGTYVFGNCGTCGLAVSGTGTVAGNGVTFYNPGTSTISINAPGTPYNSCTNSNVKVQLLAPSAGTYSGVLFFQDASDTQTMVVQLSNGTVCGGGAPNASTASTTASYALGAVYAPGAEAFVMGLSPANAGCSYIPRFTLVVALEIRMGGSDVNINEDDCDQPPIPYAGSSTVPAGPSLPPDPIKAATLVE